MDFIRIIMKRNRRELIIRILACKYTRKGFSSTAAEDFVGRQLIERKSGRYSWKIRHFARKHGFLPSTVAQLSINKDNYKDYLNDYDYYMITPQNREYHSWINNKITLKYLLGDSSSLLPKYYFQVVNADRILRLFDCSSEYECSPDGILKLLYQKKELAIKRIIGLGGAGFYKASIDDQKHIFINDNEYTEKEFCEFILSLKDYLVMEFLHSAGLPARIYPKTANSIRVIIGYINRKKYYIGGFIKFGCTDSGYVDNVSSGGVACYIDQNGYFCNPYLIKFDRAIHITEHPDTHERLEGQLAEWPQIMEAAEKVFSRLPQLTLGGFDFVITSSGIKLLEMNDKSGLRLIQLHHPLLKDKEDNYFLKKIEEAKKEAKEYCS